MHRRLSWSVVCVLALALAGPTGCKKLAKKFANKVADKVNKEVESSGASSDKDDDDDDKPKVAEDPTRELSRKLNGYITKCVNSFSSRATSSMKRYYSWCNKAKGPTGKERVVYGLYTLSSDPKKCADAVKKHNDMSPKIPDLEQAGTAYAAAVTALVPLLKEADGYYDQKDYKDDKMAKGKQMHPKLVAAFDAYIKANKALYAALEVQQNKLDVASLAVVEKREGKKMLWHVKYTVMLAKRLLNKNGYPKKIDVEGYKKVLDEYAAAVKAMTSYADDHKADKKVSKSSSYRNQTKNFLKATKELFRRARDKKKYSRGEKMHLGGSAEWMVNGSPGKVLRAYNSLIRDYNSMMRWWGR